MGLIVKLTSWVFGKTLSGAMYLIGWALGRVLLMVYLVGVRIYDEVHAFRLARRGLRCPMGCADAGDPHGRFKCSCGAVEVGWIWGRCSVCGGRPHTTRCVTCGHSITAW